MKRMTSLGVCFFTMLLVVSLALPGCTSEPEPTPGPPPHAQVNLEFLSGGDPASLALLGGVADLLSRNHPWIRASLTEVGGDEDTVIQSVDKDPTTILGPQPYNYYGAIHGVAGWTEKYPDLRMIGGMVLISMNMMSNDPNIRTLEDLKGKNVIGLTGSVTTAMLEAMLEEYGISDEVKVAEMGYGAQFDSFRDRLTVNVLDGVAQDPIANESHHLGFMEEALFALRDKVYPVEWPPDLIKKASDKLGMQYVALEIPPGALVTQDGPWHGIFHGNHYTLCTWADADEEVIYEVTKMWIENIDKLKDYHPFGEYLTPESVMEGLSVNSPDEIHPGALRYYKESGLWDLWVGPWGQRDPSNFRSMK